MFQSVCIDTVTRRKKKALLPPARQGDLVTDISETKRRKILNTKSRETITGKYCKTFSKKPWMFTSNKGTELPANRNYVSLEKTWNEKYLLFIDSKIGTVLPTWIATM